MLCCGSESPDRSSIDVGTASLFLSTAPGHIPFLESSLIPSKRGIKSKSISKDGGISSYRGLVKIAKTAKGAVSSVECDALMVDDISISNTFPSMERR